MSSAALTPARKQQLLAAQIEAAFGVIGRPYVVALVVLIGSWVQSAILWSSAPHDRILLWASLVGLCQIGSMGLIAAYRRHPPTPDRLAFWGVCKIIQTTTLSLGWGSCVLLLYVPDAPATLLVTAMSVVCVTVASTVTNANYAPGMYPLLFGNCVPGIVYLLGFTDHDADATAAGYALLTLLVIVVIGGITVARLFRETMLTRMELADAVDHKHRALVDAESARKKTAGFFSAASHDLRQPLHALGLYSGLLAKNPPENERRQLIASIESCVDSLERLFSGIMGVSESELLESRLQLTDIPVQALLEKIVRGFTAQAEEKGLQLRAVRTSLWVRADAAALERILSNLLANAIRYTERGRVLVGVRRRPGVAELTVADNGIGIAPLHQVAIFDELYQIGNPERNQKKGFGLGLYIVKRLSDAMGSSMQVHSTLGRGSRFSLTLQRVRPHAALPTNDNAERPSHDLQVLVIEDDELVRNATARTLEEWRQPAQCCATGAQAVEILKRGRGQPWHVLLDYRLADGENGIAVADRILKEINPAPVISILTGESDAVLLEAAARRGIHVLSKPLKPLRLRTLLYAQKTAQTD